MNKSDERLLEAIRRLVAKGGPPPTFDEVAVEAGLSAKSKGAVYRRLANLRGSYVDWDDQAARSLRLLGEQPQTTEPPSSNVSATPKEVLEIIRILATGLWQLLSGRYGAGGDYPDALRRGLNRLALHALQTQKVAPRHIHETIKLFRSPFRDWPIAQVPDELDGAQVLLVNGEPTSLCEELVISGGRDVEAELMEQTMVEALQLCRLHNQEKDYARFRKFIIEHPVVRRSELINFRLSLIEHLARLLDEIYEVIPQEAVWEWELQLCAYCGWTLAREADGTFKCLGKVCQVGWGVSSGRSDTIPVRTGELERWRRVNRGIRRFVVEPGRSEVRIAKRLQDMGTEVQLWPEFDAFDIHVRFPDGISWAIDVKDWENPYLLANYLDGRSEEFPVSPHWDSAFYVFPDHRAKMRPRYSRAFGSTWHGGSDRVSYAMERTILLATRDQLQRRKEA